MDRRSHAITTKCTPSDRFRGEWPASAHPHVADRSSPDRSCGTGETACRESHACRIRRRPRRRTRSHRASRDWRIEGRAALAVRRPRPRLLLPKAVDRRRAQRTGTSPSRSRPIQRRVANVDPNIAPKYFESAARSVIRKNSRGQGFKPVLVMETAENRFRSNATSLRNVVAD